VQLLVGPVQPYAWGDDHFIADLQGRPTGTGPEAELWLGAHQGGPGVLAGDGRGLSETIAEHGSELLGPAVKERFGGLPYLVKVLAAAEPLSIQTHPSLSQAQAGWQREQQAGIAWDDPQRNYRDPNHKPELICALTTFEAKCGFRALPSTRALFAALAAATPGSQGLSHLASLLAGPGAPPEVLAGVLAWLVRLEPGAATALVAETDAAAAHLLNSGGATMDGQGFEPELRWTAKLGEFHPNDAGVVVALLLNHVVLAPGQAMFLPAGNLHSYLHGAGVEVMASSDNVIRGGLTVKHVDAEELLAVVDHAPREPMVQTHSGSAHRYHAPVADFSLQRLSRGFDGLLEPVGPEIILVTEGTAVLRPGSGAAECVVGRGQAAFVAWCDGQYRATLSPNAVVWRAAVGDLAFPLQSTSE